MSCPYCGGEVTGRQATYCSLTCAHQANHAQRAQRSERPAHGHHWTVHMRGGEWWYECSECPRVVQGPADTEELITECGASEREAA